MDIFNQYMQSTPCTPDLDESRRAWLRDHPEWLIKGDSLECFLNSAEWDRQALAEFPGEFWLNINKYNEDFPVWISDIPGLVGVRLINCSIDDMNFIQFTKGANGLRHLILSGLNGVTDQGLRHISDLVNLESLKIYCYNHEAFDAAFLEGLSGDNSPLSLRIGGYKELSDAELEHISKWKRLSTCSLRVASNIRSDLPWLVGLKSLGCLHLDGNTPLIRQGIMRLAELPELRELK